MIKTQIIQGSYMDSTLLMNLSKEIQQIDGVKKSVVVMGTDMNKTILAEFGADSKDISSAGANDLVIAVDIESEDLIDSVIKEINNIQNKKSPKGGKEFESFSSIDAAAAENSDLNLAVISVPGQYAADVAEEALSHDMNVFIFSDNVDIEDEKRIKSIGREKGLLVMGPGAGTAIINNISIGIMSKARPGRIGIVAASGSGLQEVAVLVHNYGYGISQAIGTGGRDLSEIIKASTMLQGIDMLDADKGTDVIVLVSKPPNPSVMQLVLSRVKTCTKPVVIYFLGGNAADVESAGAFYAKTLEHAAMLAVDLLNKKPSEPYDCDLYIKQNCSDKIAAEKARLSSEQKYLRGLFCGGTHSEEAVLLVENMVDSLYSNISFGKKTTVLADSNQSVGHSLIDMGDEEFTRGKPHPVMDPSILNDRLLQEARDRETAVILFDILLGYGIHENPVGTIIDSLKQIRKETAEAGRYISMVASVCGTDLDPQDVKKQIAMLEDVGVEVFDSNAKASVYAALIVG